MEPRHSHSIQDRLLELQRQPQVGNRLHNEPLPAVHLASRPWRLVFKVRLPSLEKGSQGTLGSE